MTKCIDLLPCDWLISNLCYQAIEQVYLIKCVFIYFPFPLLNVPVFTLFLYLGTFILTFEGGSRDFLSEGFGNAGQDPMALLYDAQGITF